jgi:hypothetical protein
MITMFLAVSTRLLIAVHAPSIPVLFGTAPDRTVKPSQPHVLATQSN